MFTETIEIQVSHSQINQTSLDNSAFKSFFICQSWFSASFSSRWCSTTNWNFQTELLHILELRSKFPKDSLAMENAIGAHAQTRYSESWFVASSAADRRACQDWVLEVLRTFRLLAVHRECFVGFYMMNMLTRVNKTCSNPCMAE